MNTRRTPAKRVEENEVQEEIPPQVQKVEQVLQGDQDDQVPIVGGGDDVPKLHNTDIREAFLALTRAITTQVNLNMVPRVNIVESTMTSRLREFVRMYPPIFLSSKVGEDPQEFLDGVYKVFSAMGVTSREKAELVSYQLRDVSQIW
ncbi:hypothetical protein EJD97_007021 [Solanum chilense]|uniref:Gag-pol polyprotein n=1 Tax=Solanum chilense TaxID=4083 RepID=A0A6N2CID6_SOLCI|nr:hypothetical protein EJD97_007021 [Solanum chilense]